MKNFNADKLLEYLFYLFVFLLPWQTVFLLREVFIGGEKWQYGTVGIYFSNVLLILILLAGGIKYFKTNNFKFLIPNFKSISNFKILKLKILELFKNWKLKIKNFKCNLRFVLLALVVWSFLSILWSPDKLIAFYFSLKLLLAVGLFLVVKSASWRIDWKKMVFVLALAGALQGALAIGQFLTQQDFDSVILGTSRHEIFAGGTSVIENESGRWLRAYGTFPHPNILGGYLATILLLVIFSRLKYKLKKTTFFCHPREGGDPVHRQTNEKLDSRLRGNDNKQLIFILIILPIIFSGLILSFSRAAWLAFAVGLFLIFLVEKENRKELKKIIFIFLLTSLIWTSAFSPLFFSRVSGEARLEQKSISDRAEYVLQAKEIIKNNFWLGAGAGSYTKALAENNPQKPIWQIQPVHNVFLLIFAELGIIGFLLFLLLLWLIFKKINPQFYFLLPAFFVLMFFDHWLWTSLFGILLFFLIAGIAIKESKKI